MKVSREQHAENRTRILEAASRLYRERGFDGVGLDEVMKAAGLTHGALYSHFKSKDALIAEACTHALGQADESWREASEPVRELARQYLSEPHCRNAGGGCALAALGSEFVRQDAGIQQAALEGLQERIIALAERLPGTPAERRQQAIATWAGLVGSLVLARAVGEPALSEEILAAGRAVFGGRRAPAAAPKKPRRRAKAG